MSPQHEFVTREQIEDSILFIRGLKVMLDSDLAGLYGVSVKRLNEQRAGLGYEFAREVASTISRKLRYPEAWTKLSQRTRRCRI
jgi:hypothetical protein